MSVSNNVRKLIEEMLSNEVIVASWGISGINVSHNALQFDVHGFIYVGSISIVAQKGYNYEIIFGDQTFGVYPLSDIIEVLDKRIERTDNYEDSIFEWLKDIL